MPGGLGPPVGLHVLQVTGLDSSSPCRVLFRGLQIQKNPGRERGTSLAPCWARKGSLAALPPRWEGLILHLYEKLL